MRGWNISRCLVLISGTSDKVILRLSLRLSFVFFVCWLQYWITTTIVADMVVDTVARWD